MKKIKKYFIKIQKKSIFSKKIKEKNIFYKTKKIFFKQF